MKTIDLNADLGEAPDPDGLAQEAAIVGLVSSANIACGGHAGDDASMRYMVEAAKANETVIGAHPAYPDPDNFGRRSLRLGHDISRLDLIRSLYQQIIRLSEIAADHGTQISYVKPHGALYNDAVFNAELAALIAGVIADIDSHLFLMGAPNSMLERAAEEAGLAFIAEGFIDRRYTDDGHLQSRSIDGSVLKTQEDRISQLTCILDEQSVVTASGQNLPLSVQTLCLHGDSDGALDTARLVRKSIEDRGIAIQSFAHV